MKKIDRLQFLQLAGGVLGASVAAAAAACGGDDAAASGPACDTSAPHASFSMNHVPPHELVIPPADAKAGTNKTYTTSGAATHTHTVTVSSDEFAKLERGEPSILSTSVAADGHSHQVTVACT
jgi:hypothetical protein